MKISITLPSIHEVRCAEAIENINATCYLPHEIIVVSPFRAEGENVVWVVETAPSGVAYAQWRASMFATGAYITATADDYYYVDGWDHMLLTDFSMRERGVYAYVMGVRYGVGVVGTCFGLYYPNFPFMRRETMSTVGWISPDYHRGFGDCDLGMRVWAKGGTCEFSEDDLLRPIMMATGQTLDGARKRGDLCTEDDMALFVSRWGGVFGHGWDTSHLRGFNFDVGLELNPHLLSGRTVWCPQNRLFRKKFFNEDICDAPVPPTAFN